MQSYEILLAGNKAWSGGKTKADPEYFKRLSAQQVPEFLWIGCSDSRVPADMITGTDPGEIFVHRNISNMVVNADINLLSVLQYAVEVLEVKNVIVCGHYGCGGIKAAMNNQYYGIMNHWLKNIKDIYFQNKNEILSLHTEKEQLDLLTELNVKAQILNLAKTSIIQKAWKKYNRPHLHGWVYGLENGLINPVCEMPAGSEIDSIFKFDNL
ncbi:MAG: carbonic anhydrase [Ferruginibacter sp.]